MKKAKLFTKRRIAYLSMAAILMLCCLLFVFNINKTNSQKYIKSDKSYTPMEYEIDTYNNPVDSTIYTEMSDIYNINNSVVSEKNSNQSFSGQTLLIATAQDLYAFSYLADIDSSYLEYNYQLSANIDYTTYGYEFIPIAWKDSEVFSGVFNGDGFEIKGLDLVDLSETTDKIAVIDYFAMFSKNSGTISNIGLVNTEIMLNLTNDGQTINISGVAPLCGLNSGTIESVYAVDLGVATDESGITASGGYLISGLVSNNTGSLNNAYTAYSIISNYTVTDYISFHELVISNTGQTNNLYYYNASIDTYTDGSKEVVKYDNGLIGKTFERTKIANTTYCESLDDLALKINAINNSNWFTKNSYIDEVTKASIGLTTPILRGLEETSAKCFNINSTKDFLYMFELFNQDSIFASNAYTYTINADIDLSALPDYTYAYDSYINATIKGSYDSNRSTLVDVKNITSAYPTIYGGSISNTVLTEGIECFGLFPYLTGSISNINLYFTNEKLTNFSQISANANIRAIGLVSGMVEGGIIHNVNVYGNIQLNTGFGRHYIGGIAGVLTERGEISSCTTAGSINGGSNHAVYNNTQVSGNIDGNSIGGVVGYATLTNGDITDSMSAMNLTLASYNATNTLNQAIGGVIGSGYTSTCDGLANKGNISIGQTSTNYGIVYAAGVIGRHIGLSKQVNNFYNQGDITVASNSNTNYISGITNADILSRPTNGLIPSTLKNSNGKLSYWASSFTNASNITINGTNDVKTAGMVYINANTTNNNFASEISGFYNLAYRYQLLNDTSSTKEVLSATNIDFSSISNYASCVVSTGVNENNIIKAESIYNLKDLTFTTSASIQNTNMNYSGVILGKYINLHDIRNEGDLTFTISNATSNNSTLSINGVFEEISTNCQASNIFNGGDIKITDANSNTKYIDMYISGICKTNNSVITNTKYNPLNEDFDNTTVGSLNNTINNGDILVTQTNLDRNTASNVLNPSVNLYSNIYAGGITYSNSGIISNTFNLGNIDIEIFSKQLSNYHVGGISAINTGQYAQIRDCANNGDLFVIDMSDDYASSVNVGGIVSNNINSSANINQVIAFTINYGTIFGFQVHLGMESASVSVDNFHTACGGIVGQGLCNMVNIVNYGNVYSSECGGGLVAVVDLASYDNTSANIANTINYANVMAQPISYADNLSTVNYLTLEKVKSMNYTSAGSSDSRTYIGALISIFDFNSQNNVNVRYLINFYNGAAVVLNNINVPSTNIDVSTFITTRGSVDNFGAEGNYIKYAPLSTIDDELGNVGAFSENFVFRKAINGINLDENYITDSYIGDFFQFVRFDKINEQLLKAMGWETIAYADAAENLAKNLEALSVLINKSSTQNLLADAFTSDTWINNSDSTILKDYIELTIDSKELDTNLQDVLNYILFDEECKADFNVSLKAELFNTIMAYYEEQLGELNYYELLNKLLYPELVARIISGDTSDLSKVQLAVETALKSSNNLDTIYDNYINILSGEGTSEDSILKPLFENDYYTQTKINLLNTLLEGYSDETLKLIYDQTSASDSADELKYLMYLQANTTQASKIYIGLISFNSLSDGGAYLDVINENISKYNVEDYLTTDNIATLKNLYTVWDADGTIQDELDTDGQTSIKTIESLTPTLYSSTNVVAEHDYTELWNMIKTDSNVQSYIQNNYFNTYTDYTYGGTKSGLLAKATENNNTYQSNDPSQSYWGIPESYKGGITYGGPNGNDYFGVTNFGDSATIKTRYLYTPDDVCSYATYYYGPYESSGTPFNQGGFLNSGNTNYHLGFNFTAYDANQTTQKVPGVAPVFISPNEELLSKKLTSVINDKTLDEFYWNDASYGRDGSANNAGDFCWKTVVFVTTEPKTYGYLFNNYNTGTYMRFNYNYDPTITYTKEYDKKTSNIIPDTGEDIKLMNNSSNHSYKAHYLTGYISTSIMTGIWYTYSKFKLDDRSGTSLFGKNQTNNYAENSYYGVHTTDYICYTMSDLVNLDGVRTKGLYYELNGAKADNDEINIISAIVENMLSTKEGQVAVMKAISNYYKGNNVTVDNSEAAEMLLSSLANTEFGNEFVISTLNDILSLGFVDPDTLTEYNTLSDYLDSLNISLDSIKDEIIARATNDMSNFRKVILATDTICSKIEQYSSYQYDRNEINRLIYDYILDRYGTTTIDGEEINDILADSSDDMSNMSNLLVLKEYLDDNYTNSGFTFTGDWNVNALTTSTTISDNTYDKNLLAETGATISFNSASYTKLKLVFKGTITVNGTNYTNNSAVSRVIDITTNTNYTITFNSNAEFYDISFGTAYTETAITPYASVESNATWTNNYYQINNNSTATFSLGQYSGWKVSLSIYATKSTNRSLTFSVSNSNQTYTVNTQNKYQLFDVYDNLQLDSSSITITNNSTNSGRYLQIQYLQFTFTKTLSDGTVITVNQRLQNTTYTNNSITVNRNGSTETLIYDDAELSGHSSAVTFELSTYQYTQYNLNNIITNFTKSLSRNFNNYYANISDIGRYIIEDVVIPINLSNSVTVTQSSYVIMYANSTNSNGIISINNGAKPSSVTIDSSTNKYYAVYLPSAGTYTISSSNATISNLYVVVEGEMINASNTQITNVSGDVLFNLTYSNISNFDIDTIINNNSLTSSEKYVIYMDSYLNYRGDTISNNYYTDYTEYRNNDVFELITTLYGTMTDDINGQTYYTIFTESVFTDEVLKNIIELIVLADDTAYSTLIEELNGDYYDELIKSIEDENVQKNIVENIVDTVNGKSNTYPNTYLYTLSAYLGNNYLNNINTLNSSIMYSILSDYSNGIYQFMNSDNSINAEVFTELLNHLTEGNASIDLGGYGIFALSSSKGILNGQFIPDNIALDGLDSNYEYVNNHYELSQNTSANWRGGNDSNENDTTDENSVNYGVLVEMKQLKKSISTTIFTLDLITTEFTLYSSTELIDLENNVITYYVPTGANLNNIYIDTNTLSIANLATIYLNNSTTLTPKFNLNVGENEGIIKVVAEDTTIVSEYVINIIEVDINSINLTLYPNNSNLDDYIYDTNSNATFGVPYTNGYICVYLTSDKLPQGLDIKPYLTITNSSGVVVYDYELDNYAYINESGSGIIDIIVLDSMPYGEYKIKVSVFGVDSNELIFYKNPSTQNSITSFIYEGNPLTFTNNELTTYIPFGRCYSYNELISTSYLSEITVSAGASYTVEAEYEESDSIITYTVTYTVTSESGAAQAYTHYLIENNPLIAGNIANIYMNGSAVLDAISNDNTINLSFRRGEGAPSYKIKYNLTNFYTEGEYSYITNQELDYTGTACDAKYSGITIDISDIADAGIYEYNYVFNNTGIWKNSQEYTKSYIFPLITVNKMYAIDAELKRLTFLDSQLVLGAAYTVMYPTYSIRPGETTQTNEVRYDLLKSGQTSSPITVESKTINYNANSYNLNSNFYAVGTLSNAELANYAPTFGIYEYSEIYQYTTLDKILEYGIQGDYTQQHVDYEVVNTDYSDDLFIYVPYVGSDNSEKIFLIKIVDGVWTDVYDTSYTGVENPISSVSENKGSIELDGIVYTISEYAGTISADNKSLYMDYIGTPLDDHFWWVSYVIFSEDYLRNPTADNENLKFYHISLIDISNTIYFDFSFETPEGFDVSSIYLSILDRVYEENNNETTITPVTINAFASPVDGVYKLEYNLQVLPRGYFYFYLSLPEGYVCEYEITNDRSNINDGTIEAEKDAYLPPTSIVTQKVDIKITIKEQTGEDSNQTIIWAESTSEVFTVVVSEKKN